MLVILYLKEEFETCSTENQTVRFSNFISVNLNFILNVKIKIHRLSMDVSNAINLVSWLSGFKLVTKPTEACHMCLVKYHSQIWFNNCLLEMKTLKMNRVNNENWKVVIEQNSSDTCQNLVVIYSVRDKSIRLSLHRLEKRWKLNKRVPYELS